MEEQIKELHDQIEGLRIAGYIYPKFLSQYALNERRLITLVRFRGSDGSYYLRCVSSVSFEPQTRAHLVEQTMRFAKTIYLVQFRGNPTPYDMIDVNQQDESERLRNETT